MLDLEPAKTSDDLPGILFANSEVPINQPDWFPWALKFGKQLSISRAKLESGLLEVVWVFRASGELKIFNF